jgi:hypothetical protein
MPFFRIDKEKIIERVDECIEKIQCLKLFLQYTVFESTFALLLNNNYFD